MTATIRVWDTNFNLIGSIEPVQGWRQDEPGVLTLPVDHPVTAFILDDNARAAIEGIHLTVDRLGNRWGGRLQEFRITTTWDNDRAFVANFAKFEDELK